MGEAKRWPGICWHLLRKPTLPRPLGRGLTGGPGALTALPGGATPSVCPNPSHCLPWRHYDLENPCGTHIPGRPSPMGPQTPSGPPPLPYYVKGKLARRRENEVALWAGKRAGTRTQPSPLPTASVKSLNALGVRDLGLHAFCTSTKCQKFHHHDHFLLGK